MTFSPSRRHHRRPRPALAILATVTAAVLVAGCGADKKAQGERAQNTAEKTAKAKSPVLLVVNATQGNFRGASTNLKLEVLPYRLKGAGSTRSSRTRTWSFIRRRSTSALWG